MKRFLLFFSVLFLSYGMVWAQSQTINGQVLDAVNEEPVVGASIVVQGTNQGTITDVDGKFTISVEPNATLMISFIGMHTVSVPAQNNMKILLQEDNKVLDDVIVVAFGTTTKKSFTGSASVVKSEEITKRQTSNVTNSLAGQVAGVQGLSTSGQPGETSSIRIRGVGSMSASNAPLYVIDGVPVSDMDAVQTLSNSDIESVSVLKDAASNALYGARGANGVILITTKRGSTKDAQVKVDAKWGINQREVPKYNVMTDPAMYYETAFQAYMNRYNNYATSLATLTSNRNGGLGYQVYTVPENEALIGQNGKLNPNATLGYVNSAGYTLIPDDWYKELFKSNNLRQEYNVSVSGASDKLTYFTSASFLDDTGIIENSNFRRATARVNVDYQAKEWLKIGTNMSYSHADQKYPGESEYGSLSSGNLFYVSNNMAPIYPLYIRDEKGNIMIDKNGYTMYDYGDGTINGAKRAFMNQSNPASAIQLNKELYKKDVLTGKWFVQVEPYKGLKAIANLGIQYVGVRAQETANPFYGQFAESGGYASVSQSRAMVINQQYLITYANKFGDHNIDALVGYENNRLLVSNIYASKQKLFNPEVAEVSNAILSPDAGSASDLYFVQGILAQAKYDFASRYYVSASYRRDASSRFAKGHQWGNFWSVGAAWDIKGESFMEDVENIDLLKLKVSYGSQGNDNLGNYHLWTDLYTLSESNGQFATTLAYKGNEDITWETSYNFNAGIDFGFFGERLTGTIEGWRRRTEDMLYNRPVPVSLGYATIPVNVGSVSNAGLDIELRGDVVKTRNVTWSLYANMTYFKNKILKLSPELNGRLVDGSYIFLEGESMYNRYLRSYAGVDKETGNSLWFVEVEKDVLDEEGNAVLDEEGNALKTIVKETTSDFSAASFYETGDILPKVYGGFGTSLEAFGVDLSIAFAYQLGGRVYDNTYAQLMHGGSSNYAGQNWHMDILNAWTPDNTDTNVPKLNAGYDYTNGASDRWMVSSNFLSIDNITLGYSLPSKLLKKAKIEKLRIFAVADNVALFSARKGLDPRQGFGGSSSTYYSPMRTISGGLSITF